MDSSRELARRKGAKMWRHNRAHSCGSYIRWVENGRCVNCFNSVNAQLYHKRVRKDAYSEMVWDIIKRMNDQYKTTMEIANYLNENDYKTEQQRYFEEQEDLVSVALFKPRIVAGIILSRGEKLKMLSRPKPKKTNDDKVPRWNYTGENLVVDSLDRPLYIEKERELDYVAIAIRPERPLRQNYF